MSAAYEKLGLFYLGRRYDVAQRARLADTVLYDAKDLTTHAVCVGMTGSGKTGLAIGLIEEAAIDGIPVLAIDPKGDLGNLLLTFPDLKADDFAPWINPDEARNQGIEPAADVLDRRDPSLEQRAVRRIPLGMIFLRIAARHLAILRHQILYQRAIAMIGKRSRQGMIDIRSVDRHQFHFLFHQPLGGGFRQPRRVAKVLFAVRILFVPSRHDDDDIPCLYCGLGFS